MGASVMGGARDKRDRVAWTGKRVRTVERPEESITEEKIHIFFNTIINQYCTLRKERIIVHIFKANKFSMSALSKRANANPCFHFHEMNFTSEHRLVDQFVRRNT